MPQTASVRHACRVFVRAQPASDWPTGMMQSRLVASLDFPEGGSREHFDDTGGDAHVRCATGRCDLVEIPNRILCCGVGAPSGSSVGDRRPRSPSNRWLIRTNLRPVRNVIARCDIHPPLGRVEGEVRAFGEGGWKLDRRSNRPPRKLANARFRPSRGEG